MKDAADMARWMARDFVFNLEAIPADRLDWKPAPEAKSALEIAGAVIAVSRSIVPLLQGGDWEPPSLPFPKPATLEEAKRRVIDSADAYAEALEGADPAPLQRTLMLPFGNFQAARFALFPVIELIHHRAQLCYLQSLLGDREVRYEPESSERFFNPGGGA